MFQAQCTPDRRKKYGLYSKRRCTGIIKKIQSGSVSSAACIYRGSCIVGLLHDIDFEQYPEEHCLKAPELLREGGVGEDIIHSVVSHGYGITIGCGVTLDVAPEHEMEKVLFAADELTGLIWAAALMRPSKSTKDMELKSLKKKYKSKGFAAGCSREVIQRGADQLGWELEKLLTMTMEAMQATEDTINAECESL